MRYPNIFLFLLFVASPFLSLAQSSSDYAHRPDRTMLPDPGFELECSPNPFYDTTSFMLETEVESLLSVKIYNQMGYQVDEPLNEILPAGKHEVQWSPKHLMLKGGLYYARISSGKSYQLVKVRYIK